MSLRKSLSSFCLGMALLSLCFVPACDPAQPDAREALVRSLKGADVNGYLFATKEDENKITTTLTNGALRNPVRMGGDNRLVIGYANVKDKKTNATKTLKAEVVRTGDAYRLHFRDVNTNIDEINEVFEPKPCPPGEPVFNNSQECTDDFDCKVRPELLCEVNRTCKPLRAHLSCCFRNGTGFHALIFIEPTNIRCVTGFPFDIDTVLVEPERGTEGGGA